MPRKKFKKPFRCRLGIHNWISSTTIVDHGDPIRERYCCHLGCDAIQIRDAEGKWHRSQSRKPN